jgi:hypothetical protein
VLIDSTIGGQGPFRLVFDTGGTIGLIDLDLAKKLRLKQLGSSFLGLKQGRRTYPIFVVPDLVLGNQVRQPVSTIAGIADFNFLDGAVGSLAAGALTSGNCELDFDTKEWRIYPDASAFRDNWTRYPDGIFKFGNENGSAFMAAEATLNGRSFRFGLDTGQPASMRVYRRTAEAAGLWNVPRWSPAAPDGKGRVVRAGLWLAGQSVDAIVTITENPDWGAFPNGIIGLPILRMFNMGTIAQEMTVLLKRNSVAPASQRYNRAGMWIDRAGRDVRVGAVGPGSPAAAAGIAAGDRVIGADFAALVQRFMEPAGTVIPLTVERGSARRNIDLRLEDFL